jgi:hypothetical protein
MQCVALNVTRDLEHAVSRSDPKCSSMFHLTLVPPFSWDRSVGMVSKLRARRPSIDVQFPEGEREFSFFFRNVKASSGAHSAGAGDPFLGVNMAGAYLSTASI